VASLVHFGNFPALAVATIRAIVKGVQVSIHVLRGDAVDWSVFGSVSECSVISVQ
jgi:hypothetical protein